MELETINNKANSALTTGIIGTVGTGLALLGGGLNGMFNGFNRNGYGYGNNYGYGNGGYANGYGYGHNCGNGYGMWEAEQRIISLTAERDMLLSDQRNDAKMLDLYKYLEGRDRAQTEALNNFKMAQSVVNAQVSDNISINQNNIARIQRTLGELTKTVIPITNISPEPAVATTPTVTA